MRHLSQTHASFDVRMVRSLINNACDEFVKSSLFFVRYKICYIC
jgi:hypothetical protein